MSSKVRLALPMACIGVLGAACFLMLQSGASARVHMNYSHLNKIQKRIISETLASAIGPQSNGLQPHITVPISDDGGGFRWKHRTDYGMPSTKMEVPERCRMREALAL